MKKSVLAKRIVLCAVLLAAGLWLLDKLPFSRSIQQQVDAFVYENGVPSETAAVTLHGEKTRFLFREDRFVGTLVLSCLDYPRQEEIQARIQWEDFPAQYLSYYDSGNFRLAQELGIVPWLLASDDLTRFAIQLTDGRIVATDIDMARLCGECIHWNSETASAAFTGLEEIPGSIG